jgi:fibronectin type 3 domain-containing protein
VNTDLNKNGKYSAVKSRTCDLPRPEVSITRTSAGKPKLTWKKVAGAVSYKVYRCDTKTGRYKLMKTVTDGLSYTNTSAVKGKTYYYKVKAVHKNTDANSACSAVKSVTAR